MDIKDFLFGCRFTDEEFAVFSESELSEMRVLSEKEASDIWFCYCDNKLLPKSSFALTGLNKLRLITNDCGWGDEKAEKETSTLLESTLSEYIDSYVNVCYYSECALKVSARLFCDKWSDFCYPSDYLIIDCGDRALLYYEDLLYYLNKIERA
ncbi:MAG: hypothetical protein K6G33_01135 [Ruminococcus sp.]|uniref:hypothetical protein n=1 Tax=Ruminococcus sp. TaxID=41978 RepID=UPI0025FF0078|nr:hypothetical protein [Ruminococcus sp.]MCR5599337.1 hypothetical protein [Ruminococcus sp.]